MAVAAVLALFLAASAVALPQPQQHPSLLPAALAQDVKNPSLSIETAELYAADFDTAARDAPAVGLGRDHAVSWQVTIKNSLLYERPDAIAAVRLHDATVDGKFIEVGMGSPPDRRFWVAVQIPGEEGYVVVHRNAERGWNPDTNTIISYTDRAGMTVNNGMRIVVSNLDIGEFAVASYSAYGLEGSGDPRPVNSGTMTVEFLSGDPAENVFAFFPFYVTAAVGALVGVLYLSKKRQA